MKTIALLFAAMLCMSCVATLEVSDAVAVSMSPMDAAKFLKGVIEEATGEAEGIEECVKEATAIQDLIIDLAKLFHNTRDLSIEEVVKVVNLILNAFPKEFAKCEAVTEETLHLFAHWAKDFSDVELMGHKVMDAILHHQIELIEHFITFVSNLKSHNFEKAGAQLTQVIVLIDGMPNTPSEQMLEGINSITANDVLSFLSHYYSAAFGIELHLVECTAEAEDAIHRLKDIIELYKLGHVTQCLTYLMAYAGEITHNVLKCKSGAPGLIKGFAELKQLQSFGHAATATKSAAKHHIYKFPKDVNDSRNAILNHNYAKLGDSTGELTKFILAEC